MKVALSTTARSSRITAQLAYALAFALVLTTLVFAGGLMRSSASAPAPVVSPPMPTIAPAEYRLPAEPIDYADPNYIGSYGG